ncbi:tetratricopeptide repeat domain containing protein [Apiospora marii]|uniref:Tetratricopeptide repeat domain containing protein n=1 Tax=Apiospora marii TaxID=335849 RepID=A0ABR1RUZ6_9PEZI
MEAETKNSAASAPEKRQPWKDHWHSLSATKPTGDGTSHGFERGEQVIMDGNMIMDRDMGGNDDSKDSSDTKKDDAQKKKDATKKGGEKEKGNDGSTRKIPCQETYKPASMAVLNDECVISDMHYLERHDMYEREKPYSLRFPPDGAPELLQSNVKRDKQQIRLRSMRGCPDLRLDTCGFELLPSPCTISYEDFGNHQKIQTTYLTDLGNDLKRTLKAKLVIPLDFSVRRRHESFPVSTGEDYKYDQPTAMAHIDFTVREGERMIRILFGQQAGAVLQGRWQIINAWRPIKGPLVDWPLGLCDTRTVDFEADTMPGDIVFRRFFTENLQVHHNPKHAWYWLPRQTVDEVLIFKSAESDASCAQADSFTVNISSDTQGLPTDPQDQEVVAECAVSILLIPDIGTSVNSSWGICHDSWLKTLDKQDQSIVVQWYDHGIASSNLSSWEIILEEGSTLLGALYQYAQRNALGIAGSQYERYSDLLNVMAGITFLGTPHQLDGATHEQYGEQIACLLRANPGLHFNRHTFVKLKEDSVLLRDIATRFNETILRVDILSVFETKVTKLRDSSFFKRNKKRVVVDSFLSRVGSLLEQQLGLNLDHLELPLLIEPTNGGPNESVQKWLLSAISGSMFNIQQRLMPSTSTFRESPKHSASSVVSIDDVRQALPTPVPGPRSSQDAQRGSITPGTDPSASERTDSFVDVESLLEALVVQQTEPHIPCFMIDTFVRNPEFFGRSDVLSRLDECLLPSKELIVASQPDRTRVGVLSGMAGLGKTETAIEYAYSRQHDFDCIFWVRAEDTGKLETDIAQIAARLGIHDTSDPHNKAINKSLALGWLTNPFKIDRRGTSPQRTLASWLIIFDNADDSSVLSSYTDIANCGAVLITSRDPLSKSSFSSSAVDVELKLFGELESGQFLQRIANVRNHEYEAQKIGTKLGGLPIAIAQMGGMIRWHSLSFAEFLGIYDEPLDEKEVLEWKGHELRQTSRGNVSTIWAIEKLSNEARCVIEILAFLDPDSIQDAILSARASELSTLPYFPRTKGMTFYNVRTELIRSSLIRRNDETGDFWVHRVVQHVVRAKMSPEHRLRVFSSVVSRVASEWPSVIGAHDPKQWKSMEALYPHVISLRDIYLKYFDDKSGRCDEKLARAYNQMGTGWMMAGEYEKAESCFSSSIAGYQSSPGYSACMRSIPMANIGLAYWLQGRLSDAAAVLEEGLKDREEVYGRMDSQSFRTGRFLHALGNVYHDQGHADKSEVFHCRALAQYQSTIGNHHHRTADVCHKVAQHCLRNGKREQAARLVEQALHAWSVDNSAYLPEIARTTFLKAKVAMALGDETGAMESYKKAAGLRKRLTNQPKKHDQLCEADFDELVTFWSR